MILPTQRAVVLLAAGIGVALLPALVSPRSWPIWVVFVLLVVLVGGVDALLLLPPRALRIEVAAPARLFVGTGERLLVSVAAPRWRTNGWLEAVCACGPLLRPPASAARVVPARGTTELEFELLPERRGKARVDALWLRSAGPLRLMTRVWVHALDLEIPVVPDVKAVRAHAIRFLGARDARTGIKIERYEGDGSEFEALRQFVPGFDARSIDWKASARNLKLMCRQFRAERNHQVVLALDTGRLMGESLGGLARLDHAIHASLLLGYIGLRTGDRVGLCSFGARLETFLAPLSGVRAFHVLQEKSAEIEYGSDETNFTLALVQLSALLRRRALIVVFSDFVDSVTAELMLDNLDRLARRHLVLFVTCPDLALQSAARAQPDSLLGLERAVVAADLERERSTVLLRLRQLGVHVVDAPPERLSTRLLNRYLEIRRRELV